MSQKGGDCHCRTSRRSESPLRLWGKKGKYKIIMVMQRMLFVFYMATLAKKSQIDPVNKHIILT